MFADRRRFLLAAAGLPAVALAQPPDAEPLPPDAQAAVDRGLAYLAANQASDGSYPDTRLGSRGNVAVTGLAGLALMAGGSQPGRGRYGIQVGRAVEYVVARGGDGQRRGYLQAVENGPGHGAMYQHGFGALFLAEAHGMMPDARKQRQLRDTLELAIDLTVNAQNTEGGWRYDPFPNQADVSVTVAQLMALRAARNAGLYVDKSRVDKCVAYIKGCQQDDGGFCYMKGQGQGSAFPRSAAAVVGLYCAGVYDGKEVKAGLEYLRRYLRNNGGNRGWPPFGREDHFYYGHYYAALAMWTAGGAYWAEWFPAVRGILMDRLKGVANGVWYDDRYGPAYATAMACIVLQLPNNYLPILQK
jgi:hypothetical protein